MIFVPRRNIWTPQRRWGIPKFQRGIICATLIVGDDVQPVSISATNVNASEQGFASSGRVPATGYATTSVTVTDGVGPFTYSWVKISSADPPAFVQLGSTVKNNGWYSTRDDTPGDDTEGWLVTVTDTGDNNNTDSTNITVTLIWTNLS